MTRLDKCGPDSLLSLFVVTTTRVDAMGTLVGDVTRQLSHMSQRACHLIRKSMLGTGAVLVRDALSGNHLTTMPGHR